MLHFYGRRQMLPALGVLRDQENYRIENTDAEADDGRGWHRLFDSHPQPDERLASIIEKAREKERAGERGEARERYLERIDGMIFGVNKAWLFADTTQGGRASATCYSLIETAKADGLEPSAYIDYVLQRIAEADTVERLEALLPWNAESPATKKVAQYG